MKENIAVVDGNLLENEREFYIAVANQIDFGTGYGCNIDAFYDRLGFDLERPIHIVWKNHAISKKVMGDHFEIIVKTMEEIRKDDENSMPEGKRFTYSLE